MLNQRVIIRMLLSCLIIRTILVARMASALTSSSDSAGFAGKPINLFNGEETFMRTDLSIGGIRCTEKGTG